MKENILLHGIGGTAQVEGESPIDALLGFLEFVGKDPLVADHAAFDATGSERELCAAYVGRVAGSLHHDEREIAELRFASADEVDRSVETRPDDYTPWFRLGWQRLRREHWAEIGTP